MTNSILTDKPLSILLSLRTVKASQHNMVTSFNERFGKDIHFGLIKVNRPMSPEAKNLNSANIAASIVQLYEQEKGGWELMIRIDE